MMLEPIHNQKVLSPQYTQKYLPPVVADTSEVRKLIEKQYSKTVVIPATHNVIVTNFISTPQGIIPDPNKQNSEINSPSNPQILINNPIINQSINNSINNSYINQFGLQSSMVNQSINNPLNNGNINQLGLQPTMINQPINPNLSNIYQSIQMKSIYYRPPTTNDPGKVDPTI